MSEKHNFEAWYPEMPDLLFGQVMGVTVFNASSLLKSRGIEDAETTIVNFKSARADLISLYASRLKLSSPEQLFVTDDNGDTMIHEVLAFAFVEFIDTGFSIYMHDRMHELFYNGVVVSDNYLAVAAKKRLSKSILEKIASL